VELGGIDAQKSVRDVRLDRSYPWNQGLASDVCVSVRAYRSHLRPAEAGAP